MLTGWAFSLPIAQNCPPTNYLAKRKTSATVIKIINLSILIIVFAKLTDPHNGNPTQAPQSRQPLNAVLKFVNIYF